MTEAAATPFPALPAELMIYHVAELRQQWLVAMDAEGEQAGPLSMDAHAVDEVDAAGVQLLMSLAASLQLRGRTLQLVGASKPLRAACARMDSLHLLANDTTAEATP